MTKVTPPINNFNAGELAPILDARFDISKYGNGCKTLENALPLVEGGAKKMPGTYYVEPSGDVDGKSRLAPFTFSTDQAYVLEFSNGLVRIFSGDGLLVRGVTNPSDTANNYDPATAYNTGDIITVGPYWTLDFGSGKVLYVSAPYDQRPYSIVVACTGANPSGDTLDVGIYGQGPFEGIWINLADTTASKNAASAIQTKIRALGTVGGIDVSAWVVTANETYAGGPPVTVDAVIEQWPQTDANMYRALSDGIQNNYFPPVETDYWSVTTNDPTDTAVGDEWEAVTVETPYKEADLFDLDVSTQSADVLYIFHKDYPPKKLCRYSNTLWKLENLECIGTPDISRTGYNQIARIIKDITNANPATVTATDHGFLAGDTIYINHVLGMLEVNQARFLVGSVINSDTFTLKDLSGVAINSTEWSVYVEGGWAVKLVDLFQTEGEYPACGTFFEQRLLLAGFNNHPQRVCGSVSGDYENFTSDPECDDYAIQFDLVANKVDPIIWMIAQTKVACGTVGGVWLLGGAQGQPLSATSIEAKRQITIGASKVAPQLINDSMIWLTRVARIVRLLQYEWQTDKWIAPDLTRVARHITLGADSDASGIKQTAYQSEPYPILWAVRNDGQLLGMTYESQEQVYAWFRVVTDGLFESVCVVPRPNNEDRVWVVVNRQ